MAQAQIRFIMTNPMGKMLNIISLGGLILTILVSGCNSKPATPEVILTKVEVKKQPEWPSWISTEYIMGKFEPKQDTNFVVVSKKYADREGLLLRKEVLDAFIKMHKTASLAGHTITIRSATRNFNYQKGIWERKWVGKTILQGGTKASAITDPIARAQKILLYSSMPGTSRHHWGTDIDINSFDNTYFKSGVGGGLYQWMLENAGAFGFCQPYTDKSQGRTGYEEERWHWSYMPTSKLLTSFSRANMKNEQIKGFQGSQVATEVNMLENYILGIDPKCLPTE